MFKKKIDMENNQVSDEVMEEVNGGMLTECEKQGYYFTGRVTKYNAVPGKYYWFTYDHKNKVGYGKMVKSYEKTVFLWITERTHKFQDVKYYEDTGFGRCSEMEVSGDDVTLWEVGVQVDK